MSEETTTEGTVFKQRCYLFAKETPAPEEGDKLLYEGPLADIPEPIAGEFLEIPVELPISKGQETLVPIYHVDGNEFNTLASAAIYFVLARMPQDTDYEEAVKMPVLVLRRRCYDSDETPEALQLTAGRREQQNRNHGGAAHDDTHTLGDWRCFIQDYFVKIEKTFDEVGDLNLPLSEADKYEHILDKLTDISALGVAMLETGLRASRRFEAKLVDLETDAQDYQKSKAIGFADVIDPDLRARFQEEANLVKVDIPGHGGVWMDKRDLEESQAHQGRLLALKQIDSEEDYKAVMQLLEQMTDAKHPVLAEIEHLGNLANAYEKAQGWEPQPPTSTVPKSVEVGGNGFQVSADLNRPFSS